MFTGKPPGSAPVQNTTADTCPPDRVCQQGTATPRSLESLSPAERKISTDLLQLTGSRSLPPGMTRVSLEDQMEQNHQLTHEAGTGKTLVYVYIQMNEAADTTSLGAWVWNVTNSDPAYHLVVAWVDVNKLTDLASLESVRSIRTVSAPVNRGR